MIKVSVVFDIVRYLNYHIITSLKVSSTKLLVDWVWYNTRELSLQEDFVGRIKLTIEYDGSSFCGWQRQQTDDALFRGEDLLEAKPSVQGVLEYACWKMGGGYVLVEGAGRTDAGVHALAQVAHVDFPRPIKPEQLMAGLNFYLQSTGAVVKAAEEVSDSFHARFSAKARLYRYRILNRRAPSALWRTRAWHVPAELDIGAMETAANCFLGTHNFQAFRAAACQSRSPIKTLDRFEITTEGDFIECAVKARSFLHNQVRIMVGTLVWIGKKKIPMTIVQEALERGDRTQVGPTAPPYGLYLAGVEYDEEGR